MADSTLSAIRSKVRRITRSPSPAQLTDAQIDEYINTSIAYDFPSQLRLFPLRTILTFYTQPNVDTYTSTTVAGDPLFNFANRYISVHPPLFIAGIQCFFTEQRDIFYGYWPQTNTISDTLLRGNGAPGPFTGTLTATPVLQNNVMFQCLDQFGNAMTVIDHPIPGLQFGLLYSPTGGPNPADTINYVTGQFSFSFPNPTQNGAVITSTTIPYKAGKPTSALFYENKFTIRPVPDKSYTVQIEADIRPTELLNAGETPQLEQWWQYIAYLASKKVFEDRMDLDSAQAILPELKNQEVLALRTTLTTQANERTPTIYTQGKNYGFGWFGPWGGGWPY